MKTSYLIGGMLSTIVVAARPKSTPMPFVVSNRILQSPYKINGFMEILPAQSGGTISLQVKSALYFKSSADAALGYCFGA